MKPQEELQWAICRDTVKEEMETKEIFTEPSTEAKLWVIDRIAQFICDTEGEGTFRKLIYEYLNLEYVEAYEAGAMCITNSISSDNFHEYPAGRGNRTKHDIR